MPVGVGALAGNVSVAVSVNDWPTVRVALETCVAMAGVALADDDLLVGVGAQAPATVL